MLCHMTEWFRHFAHRMSVVAGTPWAFFLALFAVVCWALTGPSYNYSDTWQIIINTSTTIITFLMVFVVQSTQNRDAQAVHMKLDELILATRDTRDSFAFLEDASDEEIKRMRALLREARPDKSDEELKGKPPQA